MNGSLLLMGALLQQPEKQKEYQESEAFKEEAIKYYSKSLTTSMK